MAGVYISSRRNCTANYLFRRRSLRYPFDMSALKAGHRLSAIGDKPLTSVLRCLHGEANAISHGFSPEKFSTVKRRNSNASVYFAGILPQALVPVNCYSVRRMQSVTAASKPFNDNSQQIRFSHQEQNDDGQHQPMLRFDGTTLSNRSSINLIRTCLIFSLCKMKLVVKNAIPLLDFSRRLIGDKATDTLLRLTMFKQFCGGATVEELKSTMMQLSSIGVGSILHYAAEKDINSPIWEDCSDVEIRRELQHNFECLKDSISISSIVGRSFTAVKLSGLVRCNILASVTKILNESESRFVEFAGFPKEVGSGSVPVSSLLDVLITREQFVDHATEVYGQRNADNGWGKVFDDMCSHSSGNAATVNIHSWMAYFSPTRYTEDFRVRQLLGTACAPLKDHECVQWEEFVGRVNDLAKRSYLTDSSRVVVDAEQTYLQGAIDYVVLQTQERYNSSRAVVYNTYQAYLRDSLSRLKFSMHRADSVGYKMGVKLVRGAYMDQERAIAATQGYPDPINPTLEATHEMYDACASYTLDFVQNGTEIMLGTHNEASVRRAVEGMRIRGLQPHLAHVTFGQLLGMCDHITFGLVRGNYRAYKFVPYGPVKEVVPYLVRRAEENSSFRGGSMKETKIIAVELLSRLVPGRRRVRDVGAS